MSKHSWEDRDDASATVTTGTATINSRQIEKAKAVKAAAIVNKEKGAVRLVFERPTSTESSHSITPDGVDAYRCANKIYMTMFFSCMGNANVGRLRLLLQWPLLTA